MLPYLKPDRPWDTAPGPRDALLQRLSQLHGLQGIWIGSKWDLLFVSEGVLNMYTVS